MMILLSDKVFNGGMNQNIMRLCLFALVAPWIVKIVTKPIVQVWKFFLNSFHQKAV